MGNSSILLVGDLHLRHDNLDVASAFFNGLTKLINQKQPSGLYFMGDVYDIKGIIRIEVQNFLYEWLSYFSEIVPCYILVGNHDMVGLTPDQHAFKFVDSLQLKTQIKVISSCCTISDPKANLNIIASPYVKSGSQFLDNINQNLDVITSRQAGIIVLSHQDYSGFFYRNGTPIEGEDVADPSFFDDSAISAVFNGHLHVTTNLGKVCNIGIPFTHNFGEVSYWTGVTELLWDNTQREILTKRHIIYDVPTHIQYYFDIVKDELRLRDTAVHHTAKDFVKVVVEGKKADCIEHGTKMQVLEYFKMNHADVPEILIMKYEFTDKEAIGDQSFTESAKYDEMLFKFVDLNSSDEVSVRAKALGKEIMGRVDSYAS